ncbi:MAG: hypothetical protein A3C85_00500 [Candidatus Doudnabacteria bacterium RIFCSPHIGHO2_02_FULL_48_21]|uniref:tRNA/rRNA methyltransferase SpoU type domain-containing protein n=1 Tax=Candidatus Doudnabacteria bacterium RIFCSPLOWO2_02_FULL_48_13 TaxID=1817845 RepID=A0A1F5Q8A7_9BACT|nr:MAG: hypothetical protein A3K05_04840 [Candidatus Doudnabacteria bacterium RIFCSPHIGHO2_01_48_18]OGE77126.1 MAG: hypothetical protein A2668_03860 [Candidatus Doudnabacteria bacterium RIFCSPHIGHO2_01_FULL_48_180]OGE93841.1 MAG: hypothetical protein A3C85_00500 [Candidatus Doudnabacteria bacterium RIFCSPHIGHO2_02_FULL_48_21]OGE97633.1 MAG: hypothetical protein A3A83_04445 [Candidatus Doudnabacteria bacterium RIFCSPLOWO2_01_FULL_48_57]OGE98393.1 MAG: hypothetical protein A3J05_02350 [Candidatus
MIAILHNIRSGHNVGSIFRTVDAAGFEKVFLCGITPAPLDRFSRPNNEIAKVALGAEKYVPWKRFRSTAAVIKKLKSEGYKILAIEQSKTSIPYFRFESASNKTVLIVGSEIRGLPPAILKLADHILEIPMKGRKESLNVAVAFGVVAFRLLTIC